MLSQSQIEDWDRFPPTFKLGCPHSSDFFAVPTPLGSSSRRFNAPSRVARKGNGKNLATRFAILAALLGSPFANLSPFSFGRQYAMGNYKTSLRQNKPPNAFTLALQSNTRRNNKIGSLS